MSVGGISNLNFRSLADDYVNSQKNRYYSSYPNGYSNVQNVYYPQSQVDTYVSQEGNTCTDGKDDGKIGFFSALGNIIEGAGKGIINGIKGMFTDKDGNFNILKTVATVAMGAACIAFPAVGLIACGIGVIAGGSKLIKGVSTALGAKTDAEAKDAWEAVGDGGLTVALSAVGVKASYGAMMKSAGAGGALEALKTNGYKNTKILGKVGEYIKAFGKDAWASTKNGWNKVKNVAKNVKTTVENTKEIRNLRKEVSKIDGAPTDKECAMMKELECKEVYSKGAANIADKMDAYSKVSQAKKGLSKARKNYWSARLKGDKGAIETTKNALAAAEKTLKGAKENVGLGKLTSKLRKSTNTGKYLSTHYTKLTESELTRSRILNFIKRIKANKNSYKMTEILENASKDASEVITFLTKNNGTYYEAVNKYGYDNVLKALETFVAYRVVDETV